MRERFGLDVRVRSEVRSIDRAARTVRVREGDTGREYDEPWDRLVLSPGAAPFVPDLPGIERALPLRSVTDADRITAAIERDRPGTAVVVGGGFIGLESRRTCTGAVWSSRSWNWIPRSSRRWIRNWPPSCTPNCAPRV